MFREFSQYRVMQVHEQMICLRLRLFWFISTGRASGTTKGVRQRAREATARPTFELVQRVEYRFSRYFGRKAILFSRVAAMHFANSRHFNSIRRLPRLRLNKS